MVLVTAKPPSPADKSNLAKLIAVEGGTKTWAAGCVLKAISAFGST